MAPPSKGSAHDSDGAGRAGSSAPAPTAEAKRESAGASRSAPSDRAAESSRPGLGTEFGERRSSNIGYTSFQRESALVPRAVVEIRYNDRRGLLALGIPVDEVMGPDDLALRESAHPFPQNRFASPPPR